MRYATGICGKPLFVFFACPRFPQEQDGEIRPSKIPGKIDGLFQQPAGTADADFLVARACASSRMTAIRHARLQKTRSSNCRNESEFLKEAFAPGIFSLGKMSIFHSIENIFRTFMTKPKPPKGGDGKPQVLSRQPGCRKAIRFFYSRKATLSGFKGKEESTRFLRIVAIFRIAAVPIFHRTTPEAAEFYANIGSDADYSDSDCDLQSAFDEAATNHEDDIVRLGEETFAASSAFQYASTQE